MERRKYMRVACLPENRGSTNYFLSPLYDWQFAAIKITWEFIKVAFQGKYVGASYVDAKKKEFLNLTQGNKSTVEYEAEFLLLSSPTKGASFLGVVGEVKIAEKVKHTERLNREKEKGKNKRESETHGVGQRPRTRARVIGLVRAKPPTANPGVPPCVDCGKSHGGECWKRTGACLACGSMEHRIRNCPKMPGQARGGNGNGRGRGAPGENAGYAELPYTALIDIGSTHSYVTCNMPEPLGDMFEITANEMIVISSLGQSVGVNKLFREVPLVVQGVTFLTDLMELPFSEFDLILGMDWLVKHRATLDCAAKRMVLRMVEDKEVVVIGER
ncbi:uncharacterized protein [Gossypium hirsutum]|uniref:Retrotransposon gag domain-containing protein n=1 Tax=Gossypium hirsutum TaxID=3635 RepID=A0A1U8PW59_GOSHI|nr:uncharacterized protein LOC107963347 [Gossypium hirsutum]